MKYENLLLLMSPQNNVASNLRSLKKQSKSNISYIPGALWDKVIIFTDEPVVQCDAPAEKITSLDHDGNDSHK